MPLCVRYDETHLCALLCHRLRASYFNVRKRHEPACGHGGAIDTRHKPADKTSGEGARGTGDSHTVRHGSISYGGVVDRRGVVEDVEFSETTVDGKTLAILNHVATTLTDNLHINAAFVEFNKLTARKVCLVIINL